MLYPQAAIIAALAFLLGLATAGLVMYGVMEKCLHDRDEAEAKALAWKEAATKQRDRVKLACEDLERQEAELWISAAGRN